MSFPTAHATNDRQINIDWAGIALERATGMILSDYCQKNIFEPLGLENISFFPSQHMRDNIATML